jgi:hypothetical protein
VKAVLKARVAWNAGNFEELREWVKESRHGVS